MGSNSNRQSPRSQRRVAKIVQKVDANRFFNLLTGPELLDTVEAMLPEHRERYYPPTVTLSMFLGQALSADGSCQNAVNEAAVNCLANGLQAGSVNTGGYCIARQRLPQEMVSTLARQAGNLLDTHTPEHWLWCSAYGPGTRALHFLQSPEMDAGHRSGLWGQHLGSLPDKWLI